MILKRGYQSNVALSFGYNQGKYDDLALRGIPWVGVSMISPFWGFLYFS